MSGGPVSTAPAPRVKTPAYINGRFATQSLTGVQRFALEMTAALQSLAPGTFRLVVPRATHVPGAIAAGRLPGQAWEQLDLPRLARSGVLVNFGNTAPLLARRQILVMHDAGVFATPNAYSWKFRTWYKTLQRLLVLRGVKIVTVSAFSRAEIIRFLDAEPAQVAVIPEGADHVDRLVADPLALAKFALEPGRYTLAVGTLAAHKNLLSLDALAKAGAARGVPLVVVGGLGGIAFNAEAAKAARLPQPARYVGRVSDAELKTLYTNAAAFVFPSRYEGFGLPAVEAMACGCPVVCADIPALRETCGDAALYADPQNPEDIMTTTMRLLDDASLPAQLAAAGRARTAAMTWRQAASAFMEIFDEVRHATR
jgi:glycosyltransferase involved in cell wall biosynthesis